jgi:hypothetical protein
VGVIGSLATLYAAVATFRPSIRPYWGNGARCGKLTCTAFGVCFAAIASAVVVEQHLLRFVAIGVFLFGWLTAVVGFFQDARSFREAKQRDLTKR